MQTIDYRIPAGKELLSCSVDFANRETTPSVICLHGGGPSSKHSTAYLARALQAIGKTTIRFDFSGQGDSTGSMAKSSLKKRCLETTAVLSYFGIRDNISIIGTSMGGYIASSLTKDFPVDSLILFGPAAYSTKAWDVEFGAGFTEIIRKENSFLETDILDLPEYFSGKALFLIGENDEIIPEQVTALYKLALSKCSDFEEFTIPDCPHPIHRWASKNPGARSTIEKKVVNLFR